MARELLGTDNVSSIPLAQLGNRFIGAELLGKLANIVDEIATNGLMQEDELKKIVSGDPIQVERKNKDPFVFSFDLDRVAADDFFQLVFLHQPVRCDLIDDIGQFSL